MGKQRNWADLTSVQKTVFILLGVIQLMLLAAAQWDIHQRPEEEIRGNKWMWTAIALVNFAGPISYFLIGRSRPGQKRLTLSE